MSPRKSKRSSSTAVPGSPESCNAVLLEEIRSQMETVIEKVESSEERLTEKIETGLTEVRQEISLTQQALKATRDELKQDIANLDTKLSFKIDLVVEKVDRHDEEIAFLKTALRPA